MPLTRGRKMISTVSSSFCTKAIDTPSSRGTINRRRTHLITKTNQHHKIDIKLKVNSYANVPKSSPPKFDELYTESLDGLFEFHECLFWSKYKSAKELVSIPIV